MDARCVQRCPEHRGVVCRVGSMRPPPIVFKAGLLARADCVTNDDGSDHGRTSMHAPPCSSALSQANCNACMPSMSCKLALLSHLLWHASFGMPTVSGVPLSCSLDNLRHLLDLAHCCPASYGEGLVKVCRYCSKCYAAQLVPTHMTNSSAVLLSPLHLVPALLPPSELLAAALAAAPVAPRGALARRARARRQGHVLPPRLPRRGKSRLHVQTRAS